MTFLNLMTIIQNIDTEIVLYILTVFTYGILTLILMSITKEATPLIAAIKNSSGQ